MEWIVKIERNPEIENEREQKIRIVFDPINEKIIFQGEVKLKSNTWTVFSTDSHDMNISLDQLQEKLADVIRVMRIRLIEYENLDKGFGVLKWIGFEE